MKSITAGIIFSCMASCYIPYQTKTQDFNITFGSCFHSSSLEIKIGNFEIKDLILDTDFATGIVMNKSIAYDGSHLKFIEENVITYQEPFKVVNDTFTIQTKNAGGVTLYVVDLTKGRFIFIENCGTVRSLEMKQYKTIPIVE